MHFLHRSKVHYATPNSHQRDGEVELKLLKEDGRKCNEYQVQTVEPKKVYQPSVLRALLWTFAGISAMAAFSKLVQDLLQFASPILLK